MFGSPLVVTQGSARSGVRSDERAIDEEAPESPHRIHPPRRLGELGAHVGFLGGGPAPRGRARRAGRTARPAARTGRRRMRSETTPAFGATKIGIAVQGRIRRPACSGEKPCTVWKYCASRKTEPNMPKNMNSEATF